MSKAGYHWKLKDEKRAVPCFSCNTEPRLEGHVVCSGCHDELRCGKCNPGFGVVVPVHLSRGSLTTESEEGYAA